METKALLKALRKLEVETGSLACLGCGHEHNCGNHGCAILREAEQTLLTLAAENQALRNAANAYKEAAQRSTATEKGRSPRRMRGAGACTRSPTGCRCPGDHKKAPP